ncbi:MAG: MFS transporter, partial [Candidatus Bathyarchaeia archaeon]
PELYPTRIRATGAGWAGALARIAGIIAPIATAVAVLNMGIFQTFIGFFATHLVAAVIVAILGIETVGKTLEEISK